MANETSALRSQPAAGRVVEHDYQSFCDAVGASARGRAFLQEYARRNRHADTEVVLAALGRLEAVARSQKTSPEAERIRQDLRALLGTIHSARPQIDSTPGAIKSATLAALIEFVQARIEALVSPTNGPLAVVPEPEQRELPIPQPGSTAQRTIALVDTMASQVEPVPSLAQKAGALALDKRAPTPARNFDPDVPSPDAPRSPKIIPAVDFIETLFEKANAKADTKADTAAAATKDGKKKGADKATAKASAKAAATQPAATTNERQGPPQPVAVAAPVAFVPSAVLAAVDMPGPVAAITSGASAGTAALLAQEMEVIGQASDLTETADIAGITEAIARTSNTTAAAIDASAAAIDEIVAAAEAALVEEGARAQTPRSQTTLAETNFVEITDAEAPLRISALEPARAETVVATVAAEPVTAAAADVSKAAPATTANSSNPVVDNALSAIMALSEEERLALFT
jgi:hypothetical protein